MTAFFNTFRNIRKMQLQFLIILDLSALQLIRMLAVQYFLYFLKELLVDIISLLFFSQLLFHIFKLVFDLYWRWAATSVSSEVMILGFVVTGTPLWRYCGLFLWLFAVHAVGLDWRRVLKGFVELWGRFMRLLKRGSRGVLSVFWHL